MDWPPPRACQLLARVSSASKSRGLICERELGMGVAPVQPSLQPRYSSARRSSSRRSSSARDLPRQTAAYSDSHLAARASGSGTANDRLGFVVRTVAAREKLILRPVTDAWRQRRSETTKLSQSMRLSRNVWQLARSIFAVN